VSESVWIRNFQDGELISADRLVVVGGEAASQLSATADPSVGGSVNCYRLIGETETLKS